MRMNLSASIALLCVTLALTTADSVDGASVTIFTVKFGELSREQSLRAAVVQGLWNREGFANDGSDAVFADKMPADATWLSTVKESEGSTLGPNPTFSDVTEEELVEEAVRRGYASRRVLYDSHESWALPNVVTLCAVHDAIPVSVDESGAYDSLPIYLNTTGLWEDEHAATQFAMDNFKDDAIARDLLAVQTPDLLSQGLLVDYIVKNKLMTIWLSDMCTAGSTSRGMFDAITSDPHFKQEGSSLSIMGYFPAEEVVAACTDSHRVISLVSDFSSNLGFYSLFPPVKTLQQAPPLSIPDFDPSKVYISIMSSDGDNMQLDANSLRPRMEERVKMCATAQPEQGGDDFVCPPVSWTISNRLMTFAPTLLRWFYDQGNSTGLESFLMGPSGYGFLHPSVDSDLDTFVEQTVQAATALDMNAYVHWDNYDDVEGNTKAIAKYTQSSIHGVFSPVQPAVAPVVGDVVTFSEVHRWFTSDDPVQLAKQMEGLQGGTMGYIYKIHDVSFEDVEKFASALSGDKVVLLGYRELVQLARKQRGVGANVQTSNT